MRGFINYLAFKLIASNAHGIHSPFVFNLYTKGLTDKRIKNKDPLLQGLLRLIGYLNFNRIYCSKKTSYLAYDLNSKLTNQDHNAQLLCCSIDEYELIQKAVKEAKKPIFINDLYRSSETKNKWNKLCKESKIEVSIDCYQFGLIFFRPGQVKEHFKLRI